MNCRYCHQPITGVKGVKTLSYWQKTPDICHAQCKQAGEQQEAFDCQCIDADCNDCRYFQRGALAPKTISIIKTQSGKLEEVIFQPQVFRGHCLRFNQPTLAQPNKWTGKECFQHRKSA